MHVVPLHLGVGDQVYDVHEEGVLVGGGRRRRRGGGDTRVDYGDGDAALGR